MSLQSQVLAALALIMLTSGGGTLVYTHRLARRTLVAEQRRRAEAVAVQLAETVANARDASDPATLARWLDGARGFIRASAIVVRDADGRILSRVGTAAPPDPALRPAPGASGPLVRADGRDLTVVASIIDADGGVPTGTVALVVPPDRPEATAAAFTRDVARALVVAFLASLAAWKLLLRRALSPIRGLSEAARRLAAGEAGVHVDAAAKDDFAELSRSFNAMSEALARTTVSRDNVERILAAMGTPLLVADEDGRIRMTNPAAEKMLDWPPGGLLDRPLSDVFPAAFCVIGKAPSVESALRARDGRAIPVLVSSACLMDKDGRANGFVAAAKDITAQKESERLLREAKEEAEAASRLKSEFAATVSHELRTPLNGIIGLVQLLSGSSLSRRQRRLVGMLHESGRVLREIINDVLDLSSIDAGSMTLEAADFDPRRTVRVVVGICRPSARDKGLSLEMAADGEVPPLVRGDEKRLRQVLLNLVGNAIKYTDKGAVFVEVKLLAARPDEWLLRFQVLDTGIGIAAKDLPRLFQPFGRLDTSTSRPQGGAGLGLAISKRLVEMMGGEISVDSVPGQGSTFGFTVRMGMSASPASAPAPEPPAAAVAGARVLIVEDNPVNRFAMRGMLRGLGYRAHSASGSERALLLFDRRRYDAVLMDIEMPGRDGIATAREMRGREHGGDRTPIIAVSAHAFDSTRRRVMSADFDDFLPKPFLVEELDAMLRRRISRAAPAGGEAETAKGASCTLSRKTLLRLLAQTGSKQLAVIAEALERGDAPCARSEAHSLAGAFAVSGLPDLCAAAKALQVAAQEGAPAPMRVAFAALRAGFEAFAKDLDAET